MLTKPMGRREYKLSRMAEIAEQIAKIDERLAESLLNTREIAKQIGELNHEDESDRYKRTGLIKAVINKEKNGIEPLLQERRELVQALLKLISETHAKGMKELKEELGLPA